MRTRILSLTLQLIAIGSLWQAPQAFAQDFPVSAALEDEAVDVEICQDFICSKLREEILVEASKCRPLASFKRRRMHVRRTKAVNSCKLFHDNNYKLSK